MKIESQNLLQVAFKEWAVVVQALLMGKQSILFRKGGIVEKKGGFSVEHSRFLLFPTYLHQNEEDLIPEERARLKKIHQAPRDENQVLIEGFFEVKETHFVEELDKLRALQLFGIWSWKCLEERFHWGDKPGIHFIFGQVYRLAHPQTLPNLQAYGGCKSWLELTQGISCANAQQILTDAQFARCEKEVNSLCGT